MTAASHYLAEAVMDPEAMVVEMRKLRAEVDVLILGAVRGVEIERATQLASEALSVLDNADHAIQLSVLYPEATMSAERRERWANAVAFQLTQTYGSVSVAVSLCRALRLAVPSSVLAQALDSDDASRREAILAALSDLTQL
jgi:hypothetical protein